MGEQGRWEALREGWPERARETVERLCRGLALGGPAVKIVLYLHLHQPWRLARFRYLDLGSGRSYFDVERNLGIFRGIADRCYRPALDRLARALEEHSEFRLSLSVTGTFVEQAATGRAGCPRAPPGARPYRAGLRSSRRRTITPSPSWCPRPNCTTRSRSTGRCSGPSSASTPKVLRMTELAYSDDLARFAEREGFHGDAGGGMGGPLLRSPAHRPVLRRARPDPDAAVAPFSL